MDMSYLFETLEHEKIKKMKISIFSLFLFQGVYERYYVIVTTTI